jgi:hypothetical protein
VASVLEVETQANSSHETASKLRRTRTLAPYRFKKGHDSRRNLTGRPKSFTEFRALVQSVMSEEIDYKPRKNGKTLRVSAAEAMVRHATRSQDPALMRLAFEYAFGKVPDRIETTGLENKTTLVLHFAHERSRVEAEQNSAINGEGAHTPLLTDGE